MGIIFMGFNNFTLVYVLVVKLVAFLLENERKSEIKCLFDVHWRRIVTT